MMHSHHYWCPGLDFHSVWSWRKGTGPPVSCHHVSARGPLGSVLISVHVDWDLLVGMGKGRHWGEKARTGMWRSLTFPVCIFLPPSPHYTYTEAYTHIRVRTFCLSFPNRCSLLWSQPDLMRRQPFQFLPSTHSLAYAVLGSCSRPTRKYTMLSLVVFSFFLRWRPKITPLFNWLFNQPCK